MSITRRALLERVALIGGAGATYLAMEAMGLAAVTPLGAENFQLPQGSGAGKSVVVLGAGIAGLVAAYELSRAGYRVKVIEAQDRIGGRAWTIRGQTKIEQIGRPDQMSNFAPGQYFNPGPTRIPSTHRAVLSYAKRFGVKLEPFVNSNRNAKWDFGGKIHREARHVIDARGQIGELLAKAIDQHRLDGVAPKGEVEMIRQFLAPWALLDRKGKYVGDGASGYAAAPGAYANAPVGLDPLSWKELLPSESIALPYLFELIPDMQATMLQPVGGMDRIVYAIYDQVKPLVQLNSPVSAIRQTGGKVTIEHGTERQVTVADYCVCTIPMPVLARIPSDFSPAKKKALTSVKYLKSVKLAFQAPRFWEEDDDIYGGPAWTDRANENMLYPSNDFGAPLGVLVAAYCAGWTGRNNPDAFAALSHKERIRICIEAVEAMHPGRSKLLSSPVQVAWGLTKYSEGVGPEWPGGPGSSGARPAEYTELARPEGPIVFAGEHLSYAQTWQEGAVLASHEAMKLVHSMVAAKTS
ncbi:MAG: FAD-dependent oxidoreductase [Sphingomicrobium sp.]